MRSVSGLILKQPYWEEATAAAGEKGRRGWEGGGVLQRVKGKRGSQPEQARVAFEVLAKCS